MPNCYGQIVRSHDLNPLLDEPGPDGGVKPPTSRYVFGKYLRTAFQRMKA